MISSAAVFAAAAAFLTAAGRKEHGYQSRGSMRELRQYACVRARVLPEQKSAKHGPTRFQSDVDSLRKADRVYSWPANHLLEWKLKHRREQIVIGVCVAAE